MRKAGRFPSLRNGSSLVPKTFFGKQGLFELSTEAAVLRVQLFGVCSATQPIYIIQEYMCNGSLLNYLNTDAGMNLGIDDFIYIAFQIASGMAYLEEYNFIHRDLAARNVLLGENNIAKICDFGLARIITDSEYCAKGGKFPIKWTAPEAIMEGIFTIKSDVWSFGILLMELFTYGEPPYKGMPVPVVMELVNDGYRMQKPENYNVPDVIYDIMRNCWHKDPKSRPSFAELTEKFEKMEVNVAKQSINQRTVMAYEEHTFM
ncbi:hypothetical protein GWI33_014318 [Rhynchophorus ferrugineus]|uniref:Protein kinase domain-containing protein n=1 Tax=Rhynchophorus ferrugineus TaxID=354439 RepID=A0A834I1N5_RHYFE|nr:hypothetical protein GWI33_014318 [Rhynchophorus ferrugineus]